MTATNKCSNFGGFRCSPPSIDILQTMALFKASDVRIYRVVDILVLQNRSHKIETQSTTLILTNTNISHFA